MQHHFYITGFMGSGKTTVGQALAEKLSYRVIDTDEWIEKTENQQIKKIFQEKGEPYFRELETKALQEINGDRLIITTGGGIVTKAENRRLMKKKGKVIYLKCELDEIFRRLEGDESRPLFQLEEKGKVEKLFHARRSYYEEADYIIETTNKSLLHIVNEMKEVLKS